MDNRFNNRVQHNENGGSVIQSAESELENSVDSEELPFQRNPNPIAERLDGNRSDYQPAVFNDMVAFNKSYRQHILK